jgi:hypothetical protein
MLGTAFAEGSVYLFSGDSARSSSLHFLQFPRFGIWTAIGGFPLPLSAQAIGIPAARIPHTAAALGDNS